MELKAQELRLGNLVLWNGETIVVEKILPYAINVEFYEGGYGDSGFLWDDIKIENLSPIPITEELLLKAGFEFDIFYQKHTDGKICIYWVNKICSISWCKEHRQDILRYEYPIYIHQLQNLYFALTGSELTFKQ